MYRLLSARFAIHAYQILFWKKMTTHWLFDGRHYVLYIHALPLPVDWKKHCMRWQQIILPVINPNVSTINQRRCTVCNIECTL